MTTENFYVFVQGTETASLTGSELVPVIPDGPTQNTTTADIAALAGTTLLNLTFPCDNVPTTRTISVQNQTNVGVNGNDLHIVGAAGDVSGSGGNIVIIAGGGQGTGGGYAGGNVNVTAGAGATDSNGGNITITSGSAGNNSSSSCGTVNLYGANSASSNGAEGGSINIQAGQGDSNAASGVVTISGGTGSSPDGNGGNVVINPGSATGSGQNGKILIGGTTNLQGNAINMNTGGGTGGGNINMDAGMIYFPNPGEAGGNSIIQTGSSGIGDQTEFNGVSLVCISNYELNWANGILTNWDGSGIVPLTVASQLTVNNQISFDTGTITSDGSGNLTATTLNANNGFTGTGTYTNFTIVNGIITAAS